MELLFDRLTKALHLEGQTNHSDFCDIWFEDFDYIDDEIVAMKHFFRNVFGEVHTEKAYAEIQFEGYVAQVRLTSNNKNSLEQAYPNTPIETIQDGFRMFVELDPETIPNHIDITYEAVLYNKEYPDRDVQYKYIKRPHESLEASYYYPDGDAKYVDAHACVDWSSFSTNPE